MSNVDEVHENVSKEFSREREDDMIRHIFCHTPSSSDGGKRRQRGRLRNDEGKG